MSRWVQRVRACLCSLHIRDIGQDLIEYALLAALIALMCSVALAPVAQVLNNTVTKSGKKFKEHVNKGLHLGWYK